MRGDGVGFPSIGSGERCAGTSMTSGGGPGRAAAPRLRSSIRCTSSAGTVNAIPWPLAWIAELIPMSSPSTFRSAPPELPRLIDASVWMRPWSVWPLEKVAVRPFADTMPIVTVSPSP